MIVAEGVSDVCRGKDLGVCFLKKQTFIGH